MDLHTKRDDLKAYCRQLLPGDDQQLMEYCQNLSPETRSRFGPHPFEFETIRIVCEGLYNHCTGYIAINEDGNIIAYSILKKGYLDFEIPRFSNYPIAMDVEKDYTLAPSVADDFQSQGVGSQMLNFLLNDLKDKGTSKIVLWGGVQQTNQKAVNFYHKFGFRTLGHFEHQGTNLDMVLTL